MKNSIIVLVLVVLPFFLMAQYSIDFGQVTCRMYNQWGSVTSTTLHEVSIATNGDILTLNTDDNGGTKLQYRHKQTYEYNPYQADFVGSNYVIRNVESVMFFTFIGIESVYCAMVKTHDKSGYIVLGVDEGEKVRVDLVYSLNE